MSEPLAAAEHPPCECDSPTPSCPRYGWMKGHKWRTCRGGRVGEDVRSALLDVWSGQAPRSLGRIDRVGVQRPFVPAKPPGGPGTELKSLLAELGVGDANNCGCGSKAMQMDVWGVAGCRERRSEIVGWLAEQRRSRGWGATLAAATRALVFGAAFRLSFVDPLGSLVDEAIRRAEEKEIAAARPFAEEPPPG